MKKNKSVLSFALYFCCLLEIFLSILQSFLISKVINSFQDSISVKQIYMILLPVALLIYILSLGAIIFLSRLLYAVSFREVDFKYTQIMIRQDYSFFKDNDKGAILNVVKNIATDVSFFEASEPRSVITSLASIVCYAILFSTYSYLLTIIVFVLIIGLVYLTSLIVKKKNKYVLLYQEHRGKNYQDFNELSNNSFLIKELNDECHFFNKYKALYDA